MKKTMLCAVLLTAVLFTQCATEEVTPKSELPEIETTGGQGDGGGHFPPPKKGGNGG